jgi:hypothetical protein
LNLKPHSWNSASAAPLQTTYNPTSARALAWVRSSDLAIALALGLIGLVTRLVAVPASLWEWDDFLFASALHRYSLADHSPHPPGFPVFVAMSRGVFWLLHDERSALVAVAFVFGILLLPALFYFHREVFRDRSVAIAGALLGGFAPNVWVQGAMGRSDGPGMTCAVAALALILRGLHSRRALLFGCAVFGLGMGVRITLLPIVAPMLSIVLLLRLRDKQLKLVSLALIVTALASLCWYVPLVIHTTWPLYRSVLQQHSQFTLRTDSIWAATENSVMGYRLNRFFVAIWGKHWIMWTIYALAALGIVVLARRRGWQALSWMGCAFLPFIIFTFILNTPLSAPLYSMPYIPFFTGLAACGLVLTPRLIGEATGINAITRLGVLLAIALTIALAGWAYPTIRMVHRETSPPVRAMKYLQTRLDPERDVLIYDGLLTPQVRFYLQQFQKFMREEALPPEANLIAPFGNGAHFVGLTIDPIVGRTEEHFDWSSKRGERRLRPLSLGRYFDLYVGDVTATHNVQFLSGWYDQEHQGAQQWRWMSREGNAALLNRAATMTLRLRGVAVAKSGTSQSPTIVLRLDGVEVDRFRPEYREFERVLTLNPDPARFWSKLQVETDQVVVPSRDAGTRDDRELGLQCFSLEWSPSPNAKILPPAPDQFLGSGWFGLERGRSDVRRWISGATSARLPPIAGDAQLELTSEVPESADGKRSAVTIEVAGHVIERFQPPGGPFHKTYVVPAILHQERQVELKILARPVALDGDKRPLAMAVYYLGWRPAGSMKK